MSQELTVLLDLPTAWRRVKSDLADRVFVRRPYAVSLIETDLNAYLDARSASIREDRYVPGPMLVCDVPKGGGLIRPGSVLSHADQIVYAALVGACFRAIHRKLRWSQGSIDFSYRLAADPRSADWLRDRFTGWK